MLHEQYPKIYLYRRIVQAKLFIDGHYNNNIDLSNIADEACFSKFHFIRLFHSIYGSTPHQYLKRVRIEQAKILLQSGVPVTQVCFLVGFDSASSFTGLFKRSTGLNPSAYQQLQQQRRLDIATAPLHFIPNCFAETSGWTTNSNFEEVTD
jgi:AraC-like DNA-binding protein